MSWFESGQFKREVKAALEWRGFLYDEKLVRVMEGRLGGGRLFYDAGDAGIHQMEDGQWYVKLSPQKDGFGWTLEDAFKNAAS